MWHNSHCVTSPHNNKPKKKDVQNTANVTRRLRSNNVAAAAAAAQVKPPRSTFWTVQIRPITTWQGDLAFVFVFGLYPWRNPSTPVVNYSASFHLSVRQTLSLCNTLLMADLVEDKLERIYGKKLNWIAREFLHHGSSSISLPPNQPSVCVSSDPLFILPLVYMIKCGGSRGLSSFLSSSNLSFADKHKTTSGDPFPVAAVAAWRETKTNPIRMPCQLRWARLLQYFY